MSKFNLSTASLCLLLFFLTAFSFQNKSNSSRDPMSGALASTEQHQVDSTAENESEIDSKDVKLSIAQVLTENNHPPVAERVTLYRRLKEDRPDDYNFGITLPL